MTATTEEAQRRHLEATTRRHFLKNCTTGLGSMWLATQGMASSPVIQRDPSSPMAPLQPHFTSKVKRIIYLHMVGAPSQLELFDYKPELNRFDGKECPQEFLEGKQFAFIQGVPKMLGHQFPFQQYGESGLWMSDQLPHLSRHADDICVIKTMQTDQFNHGPAQLMVHTGNARMGNPSIGAWTTWGLGTENNDLPGFIVLLSGGRLPRVGKALWSSGFLPSVYQGVQCRSKGDPVLNVSNPDGISRSIRRRALDSLKAINEKTYQEFGNPETLTRIAQYEMAFRMQMAVPEAMETSAEPESIHAKYGTQPGREAFSNNCLLARRLAERGVRFIQLFDWGWDTHGSSKSEALNHGFKDKCKSVDQPIAALISDLKERGLWDDTLLVWGGEFGRTPMRENRGGGEMRYVGRDHNPNAFCLWLSGGAVKGGMTYGKTDPLGYQPVEDAVPLRDFHATLLHLLGFDHNRLSIQFQGLDQKLVGVQASAKVLERILA